MARNCLEDSGWTFIMDLYYILEMMIKRSVFVFQVICNMNKMLRIGM